MGEVYHSVMDVASGDLTGESVSSPDVVTERWAANIASRSSACLAIGAGHGFRAYPELAVSPGLAKVYPELLPRAREVLALAKPLAEAGQGVDPTQALPIYVRDEVAKIPECHRPATRVV
jgi:tRNA threonylcarbamoyladenosine biosynthesis protein TsaB